VIKLEDENWYLIDSTWGVKDKDNLDSEVNDFYFLTDPKKFVYTHLPENEKWQLLDNKDKYDLKKFE
jgi:transglutaminase/protease-like cytokinesis protein 3